MHVYRVGSRATAEAGAKECIGESVRKFEGSESGALEKSFSVVLWAPFFWGTCLNRTGTTQDGEAW